MTINIKKIITGFIAVIIVGSLSFMLATTMSKRVQSFSQKESQMAQRWVEVTPNKYNENALSVPGDFRTHTAEAY